MSVACLEAPPSPPGAAAKSRRLLLVAYCFPPVGGAGVQRPVKWVKYLQRAGWQTTVLTPANPSVPVLDESLLAEVPAETEFLRPRTWEPSYAAKRQLAAAPARGWFSTVTQFARRAVKSAAALALQPDPQILWYRQAVAAATERLRRTPHAAILVTAPPYSSFLIGAALKRRFGLPLILDYRDEWDLSSRYLEHAQRDRWSQFVQERQQRAVLRQADAVVATTAASVRRLEDRLRGVGRTVRTQCIYNGFDAEDFDGLPAPAPEPHRFRLVYTGTLWNLTSIAPLVEAIERLHAAQPALLQRLELTCIGRKTPEQREWLSRLAGASCLYRDVDYCDHAEVLRQLAAADALCLLLSDVPGAERVVPAKLFEYLAARRDMLAILPPGEAAGLVTRFHPEGWRTPGDVPGIAAWLERRLTAPHTAAPALDHNAIDEFSRERQTGQLIDLLEALVERRVT